MGEQEPARPGLCACCSRALAPTPGDEDGIRVYRRAVEDEIADAAARTALREWVYAAVREGRYDRSYFHGVHAEETRNARCERHRITVHEGCYAYEGDVCDTYAAAVTSALAKRKEARDSGP